jgi:probable O-glycosylation ligase (exosortase A-associated)
MTLSLAFYGVKGGIFTILNGGSYHVRGPSGSFIGGDNEIGLALIMTIPLLRYLQLNMTNVLLRFAMWPAMLLTAIAVVGSQSRGALLGIVAMGAFLWLKSRNKFVTLLMGALAAALILAIMPPQWFERMESIKTYEQDASVMGRFNAWHMAFNLAKSKPLGGGFETFQRSMFAIYAPEPDRVHDAHSIYFEVLGEHGFVGLALFLLLGLMTWRTASSIIGQARGHPEKRWAADLAAMVQVSLVGYAAGGAFLGLAYFDFYYTLIAVVVLTKTVLIAQQAPAGSESGPVIAGSIAGRPLAPRAG